MHAQAVLSETFCAVSRTSIAYIDVGERLQIYSMSHLDSLRPCAVIQWLCCCMRVTDSPALRHDMRQRDRYLDNGT